MDNNENPKEKSTFKTTLKEERNEVAVVFQFWNSVIQGRKSNKQHWSKGEI